jgi:hypothetical protein
MDRVRNVWRLVLALLLAAMATVAPGRVQADCAWPSGPQALARADVVLFGRVAAVDIRMTDTYYTVVAEQIYKGQPANPVIVRIGSGSRRISSEDYRMQEGTAHTLYLRAGSGGNYETDACSGSHEGRPGPEETPLLGQGQAAPPAVLPTDARHQWTVFIAMAVAFGAVGLVVLRARRKRPF